MASDDRLVMVRDKLREANWDNLHPPDEETVDWFLQILGSSASEEEPKTWGEMMCQVARDFLTDFDGEEPGAGGRFEVVKDDLCPD